MALVFSRRSVLTQLAAIPITAGFARNLLAQSADGAPAKNLVIFMQNNGTKRIAFWPPMPNPPPATLPGSYPIPATSLTTLPILNTLFTSDGVTDNGLKAKTNLLAGLQVTIDVAGAPPVTGVIPNAAGFARMFTGAPLIIGAGAAPFGGAISIDQMLAKYWSLRSLTTAVVASQVEPFPHSGFNCLTSFSYDAPATMHTPYIDPYQAFMSVFAVPGGPANAQSADYLQRLATRKSVLNSVYGDLQELQGRLGPDDGHKLDYHLNAIREVELQLEAMLKMTCSAPMGSAPWFGPGVANGGPPAFEVTSEIYNDAQIQFMASLISAAIRCRLTRVASLQFGYGRGSWAFGWLNPANTLNPAAMPINTAYRNNVAHHDVVDDMSDGITANWVIWANQYFANTVRKVATDLLAAPDGRGGTMLDHTLIIWSNEVGRGDEQLTNIPIVFLGLVNNGISAGGRVVQFGPSQTDHRVMGYHALKALGYDFTRSDASTWNVPNLAFSGF
jgi:hypothetical protein